MALIYILEDDYEIGDIECFALKNAGYEVQHFSHASDFFAEMKKKLPNLVILDMVLPDADGLKVIEKIRKNHNIQFFPILLISDQIKELDIVKGLDAGADDYMGKPFGVMEFVSRVKALMRRLGDGNETIICAEHIVIDKDARKVYIDGELQNVTYKEFELLYLFMKHNGTVLTRDYLMEKIWGIDFTGESRTLDMHIRSLRKKMDKDGKWIKTIRNVGYCFELPS